MRVLRVGLGCLLAVVGTACTDASPPVAVQADGSEVVTSDKGHSVVIVTVDTWRADHFNARLTPNLWAFAEKGLRVETAWSPMGLTSPAHATLLSGVPPWEHGLRANNHHGYRLDPTLKTLPVLAQAAGYATAAFVSAYPAGPAGGMDRGFDRFDGPDSGERPGSIAVEKARAWLAEQGPTAHVFLWVHVYEPHGPYTPDGDHLTALGFEPESASDVERYAAEVHQADEALSILLTAVEGRPDTAVVIASDHGEVLLEEACGRQHERSIHPAVLKVPLVFVGGGFESGVVDGPLGLEAVAPVVSAWLAGGSARAAFDAQVDASRSVGRVFWAESGLCEPGCAPGCAPSGLLGRDKVVHGDGWRLINRPGKGRWSEGAGAPAESAWGDILGVIPDMVTPSEPTQDDRVRSLGYSQ